MIITDEQVEIALSYLNMVPHPLAKARKDVVDAETRARRSFASAPSVAGANAESGLPDARARRFLSAFFNASTLANLTRVSVRKLSQPAAPLITLLSQPGSCMPQAIETLALESLGWLEPGRG